MDLFQVNPAHYILFGTFWVLVVFAHLFTRRRLRPQDWYGFSEKHLFKIESAPNEQQLGFFKIFGHSFELDDVDGSNSFFVFIIVRNCLDTYVIFVIMDRIPEGLAPPQIMYSHNPQMFQIMVSLRN